MSQLPPQFAQVSTLSSRDGCLGDPFRDAAYYVERYGYDVEAGRAAPHTNDLDTALPVQLARRRDEL